MTQSRFFASDLSLRSWRHRGAATLAVVLCAFVLAGCGGGGGADSGGGTQLSKTQYESRIQKDGDDIKNVFEPLSKPPKSLDALASNIAVGQKKLRAAADDLDSIKPPSDVAHDNDVLADGLRTLANELDPLRKGAEKNDPNLVRKAVTGLQSSNSLKDAQKATEDMKKKGYSIGTLGK
jgi:predicted small secreted protein